MQNLDWLLDTNIMLRFSPLVGSNYPEVRESVHLLQSRGATLYYTSQNLSEFWNVCTRPMLANGMGLSIDQTEQIVLTIERSCVLAPDSEATHSEWRKIVLQHQVIGAKVHDARIVASMRVNRIRNLITLNARDFVRYRDLQVRTPQELLATSK